MPTRPTNDYTVSPVNTLPAEPKRTRARRLTLDLSRLGQYEDMLEEIEASFEMERREKGR